MAINRIAIVGKIRSGKNTFADYLTSKYGHRQYQLGDGIKEVIMMYFPEAIIEGKPRKHYQTIGQSFRELNPNIWIEVLEENMTRYLQFSPDAPVIIPDVRQPNEAEYLKKLGFTIIKVESEEEIRLERIKQAGDVFSPEQLNHETELATDLVEADYIVTNNDTLEALLEQADFIIEELKGEM